MSCNSENIEELHNKIATLTARVAELERVVGPIYTFLNNKFGVQVQAPQYTQANDRGETGMGAIVSADRSSFI